MNHDFGNAKRGAVISSEGKTRVTLYLDDDVLAHFREVATGNGCGYQTVINSYLRAAMSKPEIRNVLHFRGMPSWLDFMRALRKGAQSP